MTNPIKRGLSVRVKITDQSPDSRFWNSCQTVDQWKRDHYDYFVRPLSSWLVSLEPMEPGREIYLNGAIIEDKTTRARLKKEGKINTLSILLKSSPQQLLRVSDIGPIRLNKIINDLLAYGSRADTPCQVIYDLNEN